jgi:hypothetical protein
MEANHSIALQKCSSASDHPGNERRGFVCHVSIRSICSDIAGPAVTFREQKLIQCREKMFRDRLRLWGMNDKNQRRALMNFRGVKSSTGNYVIVSDQRKARHLTIGTGLWIRLSIDARIHDALSTPKEFEPWQRALQGVLDWQKSLQDSAVEPSEVDQNLLRDDDDTFYKLLLDVTNAVFLANASPWFCKSATRRLEEASAAMDCHLKSTSRRSNPAVVLRAAQTLQILAGRRNSSEWHDMASKFLLKATAETLPACHPTLLLMKALILDGSVSEGLSILYELGFDIIQQNRGDLLATAFQYGVIRGALSVDRDAAIGSHADSMFAAESNIRGARRLYQLAELSRLKGRFAEAVHLAQEYLAQLPNLGSQHKFCAVEAWWSLSQSQRMQQDTTGEEESLLNALTVVLAVEGYTKHGVELSINVLQSLSDLYRFYERNSFQEKCEALRIEYPSAFEI